MVARLLLAAKTQKLGIAVVNKRKESGIKNIATDPWTHSLTDSCVHQRNGLNVPKTRRERIYVLYCALFRI